MSNYTDGKPLKQRHPDNIKTLGEEKQLLRDKAFDDLSFDKSIGSDNIQSKQPMRKQTKYPFAEIEWPKEDFNKRTQKDKLDALAYSLRAQEELRKEKDNLINKPDHYHNGGMDIYEIMQAKYNVEKYRGFCLGNIMKYTLRYELKGGLEDLKKAQFNVDRLIESHEGIKYVPAHKKEVREGD